MDKEKVPFISITANVHDLDELKGLLPDIAALQEKYKVDFTIKSVNMDLMSSISQIASNQLSESAYKSINS